MRQTLLLLSAVFLVGCIPATLPEEPPANEPVLINWEVTELEPGEFDTPRFELALTLSRGAPERVPLDAYTGSFVDGRESPVVEAEGAILTGASWFAGAGDEFYVTRAENGYLEIWHRVIEEQVDPGEYTLLRTVGIPPEIPVEAGE